MKDNNKYNLVLIVNIAGGIGYWLVQFLLKIYEKEMVSKIGGLISLIACIVWFIMIVYLIFFKKYIVSLCFTSITICFIIISIGQMNNNYEIKGIGILLLLAFLLIWLVIFKKYGSKINKFRN